MPRNRVHGRGRNSGLSVEDCDERRCPDVAEGSPNQRRVGRDEYNEVSVECPACRPQAPSFISEGPRRDFACAETSVGETQSRAEIA